MSGDDIRITCPLLFLHPLPTTVLATYISISAFNLLVALLIFLPLTISILKSSSPYLPPTTTTISSAHQHPRLQRLARFVIRHRSARCFVWFLHVFCLLSLIVQAFVLHSGFICGNGGLLGLPMKRERAFYGWSPAGGWVVYIVQVLMVAASAVSLWKLLKAALQKALKVRLQVRMDELTAAGKGKGKGKEGAEESGERGRRVLAHHDQSGPTTDTTTTAINSPWNTDPNTPLPTRPHTPANGSTTATTSRHRMEYLVWEGIETITAGPSLHLDPRGGRLPDPGFTHAIARRNLARRSGMTTPTTGPLPPPHRPRTANRYGNGNGNGNGKGSSRAAQRRPLAVDEQGFPFPRPTNVPGNGNSNGNGEGSSRAMQRRPPAVDEQGFPLPNRPRPGNVHGNGEGSSRATQRRPLPVDEQGFPFPRMPPRSLPPRCQSRGEGVYIPLAEGPGAQGRRRPPVLRQIAPMPITGFSVPIPGRSSNGTGPGNGNGKGKAPTFAPAQPTEAADSQGQDEGEGGAQPAVNPTAPAPEPETGAKASVNINGSSRLERLNPRKQTEEVVFELASTIKPQPEVEAGAKKGEKAETGAEQGKLSRANSLGERTESESEAVEMGMPPLERCPKRVRTLSSPDSGIALDEMV